MADNDQTTGSQLATAGGGAVMIEAPQNPYLEGIARLSIPRQVGVIVGLAATVALAVWLVLWTREADMRPLYGSLENLDSPAVIGVLESSKIPYRLDPSSGMLLVEDGRYSEARLKLAEAGMPNDSSVGFEMLDKEQGLGTSQFMETARFRRGLEGELARTISSITSVRSARVHLAIPERSVFVRDQRKPSASVLLEVVAGRSVEDAQVRAIGNLVASSVPDMELAGVTIVDQKGRLLSNFAEDREAVLASKQLDFTRNLEDQMVERVRRILEPIVGAGRFKAEVTADVDFTAVEQADEIYNPDLPAIRSEQRSEEQRLAGEAGGGIPGALSNQPPVNGAAPETVTPPAGGPASAGGAAVGPSAAGQSAGNLRTQSTRNYELDRTLSYTRHQVGKLRRLSVAVVLDDRVSLNAESGQRSNAPWDAQALERVTTLVRDAVGYDARRGDSVNVVNTAFFDLPVDDQPETPIPLWEQSWFWPAVRLAMGAMAVLLLVFAVVRPVLRTLSSNARQMRALEERHRMERMVAESAAKGESGDDSVPMLPPPNREYERRMTAVQALVEGDAEKVAQVVRKWVRESE
jgi:flagellar M-ring protein FliF